jgi:hypothetical protein
LIAAAENRATPLNIPPSAKERRKVEKAAEEAERESQRGTPAPISIPGLPPTLAAGPRDEGEVVNEEAARRAARENTAAIAERLVQAIGGPPPTPRGKTPLNLYEASRQKQSVRKRKDKASPSGSASGEENEEYDEEGQPIRKKAKTAGKVSKVKAAKTTAKKAVDPQKKRYNKAKGIKSKTPALEGDEEDEEMNELDISDDEGLILSGPRGPRDRQGGAKRKRTRT